MSFFRDSLSSADPKDPLTEEELNLLDRLAVQVVKRSMSVPSIIFLESIKPMNFIASQALVFFEPIVQAVFNFRDYDTLRTALEKRQTIEVLLRKIEEKDAIMLRRQRAERKFLKAEKKKWKWYQRWLGIRRPRITVPESIRAMPTGLELPEPGEASANPSPSDTDTTA